MPVLIADKETKSGYALGVLVICASGASALLIGTVLYDLMRVVLGIFR
jgi:hypothetical protein